MLSPKYFAQLMPNLARPPEHQDTPRLPDNGRLGLPGRRMFHSTRHHILGAELIRYSLAEAK